MLRNCRRSAASRGVPLPKPELLGAQQFQIGIIQGGLLVPDLEVLVPRCPVALASGCDGCKIDRNGARTRYGVLHTDFPISLNGVPYLKCLTHKNAFSILTAPVWQNLPIGTVVIPEICVLTNRTIVTSEFYFSVTDTLKLRTDFKGLSKELRAKFSQTFFRRLEFFVEYVMATGTAADIEVVREIIDGAAHRALVPQPTSGEAHAAAEGVGQQEQVHAVVHTNGIGGQPQRSAPRATTGEADARADAGATDDEEELSFLDESSTIDLEEDEAVDADAGGGYIIQCDM